MKRLILLALVAVSLTGCYYYHDPATGVTERGIMGPLYNIRGAGYRRQPGEGVVLTQPGVILQTPLIGVDVYQPHHSGGFCSQVQVCDGRWRPPCHLECR